MVNVSNQQNGIQNETSSQRYFLSERIAWLTVVMTESVAIVTLNILTIIVFIKNHNLRKRSIYLVINLAVVDMFTGGFTEISCGLENHASYGILEDYLIFLKATCGTSFFQLH